MNRIWQQTADLEGELDATADRNIHIQEVGRQKRNTTAGTISSHLLHSADGIRGQATVCTLCTQKIEKSPSG
jgi:hypothetical protein